MRGVWHDIRYGLRMLTKSPGFLTVALLTLALGIGANTAIFSVVDAVLLHPLPYPEPGRLVALYTTDPRHNSFNGTFSYSLFRQTQPAVRSIGETAAYTLWPLTVTRPGEPKVVLCALAGANLFTMLGARPKLGRLYTRSDAQNARPVALISEAFWRSRFHADPSIVGKTVELDHRPYSIVGVLPASLRFPMLSGVPEVWLPLSSVRLNQMFASISGSLQSALPGMSSAELNPDNLATLSVLGRLAGGATAAQMQSAAAAVAKHMAKLHPEALANSGAGVRVAPLAREVEKGYRTALLLLLGAVGLVLLIACANVANLLLARATTRQRELALRMALGSGKARVVRQTLVESVELSLAGGAAGVYLAYLVVTNLGHWVPQTLAQVRGATVNGHVLAFAAAVSVGAGVLFGSLPVWGIADLRVFETLKEGGRGQSSATSGRRLRDGLAVAEVALAVILLVGSGLLLRSFVRVLSVNPGYNPGGVLLAQLNLPTRSYAKPDQWRNFVLSAMARLRAEPGVQAVAAAVTPPVARERIGLAGSYQIVGHPLPPEKQPTAAVLPVSPGYFKLMRVPLLRGRAFAENDREGSPKVCIVSRDLANEQFGATGAIGRQLGFTKVGFGCEIVGAVGDVLQRSLTSKPQPAIYFPFAQFPFPDVSFLVRTSLEPASVTPAVRSALHEAGPDVPISSVDPMEQLLSHTMDQQRFRTLLVGMFAGLAILLAAVGISGVLGYSVSRRTQEIGVRLALGATPADILKQVVGEGLRLVAMGGALGLGLALLMTRLMRTLLYGIGPRDAITYVGVAALLLVVALGACALPALRAARVDPTVALRYE